MRNEKIIRRAIEYYFDKNIDPKEAIEKAKQDLNTVYDEFNK